AALMGAEFKKREFDVDNFVKSFRNPQDYEDYGDVVFKIDNEMFKENKFKLFKMLAETLYPNSHEKMFLQNLLYFKIDQPENLTAQVEVKNTKFTIPFDNAFSCF